MRVLFLKALRRLKVLNRRESGFSLIEVLVAFVILSLISAVFCGSLSSAARADYVITERSLAESLALSQIERIKSETYIDFSDPLHGSYTLISAPAGYTTEVSVTPINPATGTALCPGSDNGVQRVAVTVRRNSSEVITLQGYKVQK